MGPDVPLYATIRTVLPKRNARARANLLLFKSAAIQDSRLLAGGLVVHVASNRRRRNWVLDRRQTTALLDHLILAVGVVDKGRNFLPQ